MRISALTARCGCGGLGLWRSESIFLFSFVAGESDWVMVTRRRLASRGNQGMSDTVRLHSDVVA